MMSKNSGRSSPTVGSMPMETNISIGANENIDLTDQSTLQQRLPNGQNAMIIVESDEQQWIPPTMTTDNTNDGQNLKAKKQSTWSVKKVRNWFYRNNLVRLHEKLSVQYQPFNGFTLKNMQHLKRNNYNEYMEYHENILKTRNLIGDFKRFGHLLDDLFDNIYNHRFDIAFSFSGAQREKVSQIAQLLCQRLNKENNQRNGKQRIFYDKYHEAELARPNLDLYLDDIYRHHSLLIVVFMSREYDERHWCGVESRSIRTLIQAGLGYRIMLLTLDGYLIRGITPIDGHIDIQKMSGKSVVKLIYERYKILDRSPRLKSRKRKNNTTK